MVKEQKKIRKMVEEVIETPTSKIWLGEDGILRQVVYPNVEITIDDVKEYLAVAVELSKGKKIPVLVDTRKIKFIDRKAREYITKEGVNVALSLALLIDSPLSRMIGNFFLGINRPSYPVKLFTSETKALEWLKGFHDSSVNIKGRISENNMAQEL